MFIRVSFPSLPSLPPPPLPPLSPSPPPPSRSLWLKGASCTLQQSQADVKLDFPLPIVARNLIIEYADFYESGQVQYTNILHYNHYMYMCISYGWTFSRIKSFVISLFAKVNSRDISNCVYSISSHYIIHVSSLSLAFFLLLLHPLSPPLLLLSFILPLPPPLLPPLPPLRLPRKCYSVPGATPLSPPTQGCVPHVGRMCTSATSVVPSTTTRETHSCVIPADSVSTPDSMSK